MARSVSLRNVAVTGLFLCAGVAALGHASHVVLMAASATVITAALVFVRQALRHRRLTRGLLAVTRPAELHGIGVRLGPVQDAAFVAGLAKPRIFCDDRLATTLSDEELQAVTLHEQAHQRARDPLRMALLAVVAPVARRFPSGPGWLERQAANREIAADRAALTRGASRTAIASALLKVGRLHPAGATGFAPAVDLRIRALLDGEQPAPRRWGSTLAGLGLAVSACLLMFLHWSPTVLGVTCC